MPGPMGGPRAGHVTEKAKDFKGTTKKINWTIFVKIQNRFNYSYNLCSWKYNIFNYWT